MSFLRRLLSGDYRRGLAAEAAGEYAEAARHYALAGAAERVAAMHILRAGRAPTHTEEIDALEDALRWSPPESPLRVRAARSLGEALLARARTQGVATERDRAAVREAARLLEQAGEARAAGEAWELLGDDEAAARAYAGGGLLERMEDAFARDAARAHADKEARAAHTEYELHLTGGDRDGALAALRRGRDLVGGDFVRLHDELAARLIVDGRVTLRRRPDGAPLTIAAVAEALLGRDPDAALVLRDVGVSRRHAVLRRIDDRGRAVFVVRDAGSRHGTWLEGLPVAGDLPLVGEGALRLGPTCELRWTAAGSALSARVVAGLDRGARLIVASAGAEVDLGEWVGVPATLELRDGRPVLRPAPGAELSVRGARLAGALQLVRGDVVGVGPAELEVA